MRQLKNYEACEIEIISLADVITSSSGFDGDLDDFGYSSAPSSTYGNYEW